MPGHILGVPVDYTRPPSTAERKRLETRLRRLYDAEASYDQARANMATLADASRPGSLFARTAAVRVRDGFVFRSDVPAGSGSDRKLPPKTFRPPAAQVATPRGAALRLLLIALFEAQTHTSAGAYPDNPRPLRAHGSTVGWTDLLMTDAKAAGSGLTFMSIADKKDRHLYNAIDLLHDHDLVELPNGGNARNKHDGFLLKYETGRRVSGENPRYEVPDRRDNYFTLPAGLFIHGWIHVLEDSELRYLLMLRYLANSMPNGVRVRAEVRLLHMGIGPDAYESHAWFSRFGLNDVVVDDARRPDGTVDEYSSTGKAKLHTLHLLPDGFEQDAFRVVTTAIEAHLSL